MNWQPILHSLDSALKRANEQQAAALDSLNNTPLNLISATALSGGDIHQAYRLQTTCGDFFVKLNNASAAPLFETEAHSLQILANTQTVKVPKVIKNGAKNDQTWLILAHISLQNSGNDALRGETLAKLHQAHNPTKQFGWAEDNYIGHTLQKNTWQTDWATFYGEQRLRPQLHMAVENGASASLLTLGNTLIDQLDPFFQHYQPSASPLHGDLWAGNSAFSADGTPIFFDPASYYGDRETDLAMTELFGGYSRDFYQAYQRVYPLDAGYETRKPLYNLYHILNHFNLFGGHYESQALRIIQTLLK